MCASMTCASSVTVFVFSEHLIVQIATYACLNLELNDFSFKVLILIPE